MYMRHHKLIVLFSLFMGCILLASCGSSGVGTIPSGTPDLGNGTPAVIATPSATAQAVPAASASARGNFYAYVRQNQLWVARNGAGPVQVTHFDYTNLPNVFWHLPLWSPDDHFIAFIMNAGPAGLGGGGCPGPDYAANGALYLLNTSTLQLTRLVVPADRDDATANSSHNGYWQYAFWEDQSHLLAWSNGIAGKTGNTAGLYRYDLHSQTLTQVVPLSSLGVATLFNVQKNMPLLLSMRYSKEQLFYSVIVHPFGGQGEFEIYRHSVSQPNTPTSKVVDMGSESWCSAQSGPYIKPGWDISPDGNQLVAQMITAAAPGQGVASISVLNLSDGSTTNLFTQLPSPVLSHDLLLTWGPDDQTVVATQLHMLSPAGPYSATLANPAGMQQYTPNLAGIVSWRADSSAFALQNTDAADGTVEATTANIYIDVPGDAQGRLLLPDARNFVWG